MSTESLSAWLVVRWSAVVGRLAGTDRAGRDRGDVPGWVMITVMTAALVVAILVPFRTAIVNAVTRALNQVTGG